MIELHNWAVVSSGNPYQAPELSTFCLTGQIEGHPLDRHYDGKEVITSRVREINGRTITTQSGSVYELQNPSVEYAEWCEEQGHVLDPNEPLRWVQ